MIVTFLTRIDTFYSLLSDEIDQGLLIPFFVRKFVKSFLAFLYSPLHFHLQQHINKQNFILLRFRVITHVSVGFSQLCETSLTQCPLL
ncbi:hypothetical protein Hanom_Chr14g01285951 [Helianthus anomalus]